MKFSKTRFVAAAAAFGARGERVDDPGDLTVTQVNVNDDTPEGLESDDLDIITRQYHPEANPGPHDSLGFFDDVLELVETDRARRLAASD